MPFDPATEPRAQNEVAETAAGERHDEPTADADPADPFTMPRTPEERGMDTAPARVDDVAQEPAGDETETSRVQVNLDLEEVVDKLGNVALLGGLF